MKNIKKLFSKHPNIKKGPLISKYINKEGRKIKNGIDNPVLIELPLDPIYILLFKSISDDLKKSNIHVEYCITRSVNISIGVSLFAFIKRTHLFNIIMIKKWLRLADVTPQEICYKSTQNVSLASFLANAFQALIIFFNWRRAHDKEEYPQLTINGIKCEDLLIDTFLRYQPSPVYSEKSWFNLVLLYQILKDIDLVERALKERSFRTIIVSYSTYIEHGILLRVGIKNGINVFSFGDLGCFALKHNSQNLLHSRRCDDYKNQFDQLDPLTKNIVLNEADSLLSDRFEGRFDPAMLYMKFSSYTFDNKVSNNTIIKGAVILFLHDFYDSPHIQEKLIFRDFYCWARETILFLRENKIPFFIKPHPNQVKDSDVAFQLLKKEIGLTEIIDSKTSNLQIFDAGIKLGLTVYGSISHELAYFGIKSVSAACNPHMSFSFCATPNSKPEYFRQILIDFYSTEKHTNYFREESKMFYAIHNYLDHPKYSEFIKIYNAFWFGANESSKDSDVNVLLALARLRSNKYYKDFVGSFINE